MPPTHPYISFSGFLRSYINQNDLTIKEFCRKAKISPQTFHRLAGEQPNLPQLETLFTLAQTLEIHPTLLLQYCYVDYIRRQQQLRQIDRPTPLVEPAPPVEAIPDQALYRSAFIADVTIEDGTICMPGAALTKIWRLQNVGQNPWRGFYLRCMDEPAQGFVIHLGEKIQPKIEYPVCQIEIPEVQPHQTVDLAVEFFAPMLPGSYFSVWKMVNRAGELIFPESTGIWLRIKVNAMGHAQRYAPLMDDCDNGS